MIGEHRIFFVDGMKVIGQIVEVTTSVVIIKNPIEIGYEETDYGQVIVVGDMIKESNTNIAHLQKSNISFTCDVSPEMLAYYNIISKEFYEQREKTKLYLNSLSNLLIETKMLNSVRNQLQAGKVIQITSNILN